MNSTLRQYLRKKVAIEFTDGEKLLGVVTNHTSALDNEPEPESICIGNIEILVTEIKSIHEVQ